MADSHTPMGAADPTAAVIAELEQALEAARREYRHLRDRFATVVDRLDNGPGEP